MTALLNDLYMQGFKLTTDGKQITISPASRLTKDLVLKIKADKTEIIQELQAVNNLPPLTQAERRAIESWFDFLGDYKPETRAEYLAVAERDAKCRADFLKWARNPRKYFGSKAS